MPKEQEIVHVLDVLTIGSLEAAPTEGVKAAQRLRKIIGSKNIVGVGVGEKVTGGKPTGTLALCFYVEKKLPLRKMNAADAVPAAVPPSLGATPTAIATDVVVLGRLHLDAKRLRPGESVANVKVTAGTLGAIVRRGSKFELLSNRHVFATGRSPKAGAAILMPGAEDGGKFPKDVIARLARFGKFVTGGAFVNVADCATATPLPAFLPQLDPAVPGLGIPRGTIAPKRGMKIVKVGRSTGKTTGVVRDIHFRVVFPYDGIGRIGFLDQVLCSRYSSPGDSGALILDSRSKRAVGLHFASNEKGSVFHPIQAVLDAVDVELVTKRIR